MPAAVICPASPCPATYPSSFPAPLAGSPVPAGTYYIPKGAARGNPAIANTWTWLSIGTSNYNALQVDVNHHFSEGLSLRGVYTWSKALDDGDSLNQTTAANAPGLISNPYDIKADWGPATFDVRNLAVISAVYELPFGRGKKFAGGWNGFAGGLVGGWSVNSIVLLQSGFPFTPQLSYNPSNDGDTRNPVRPFINPNFTGSAIIGSASQWFNPNAFLQPPANSGFFGNLGRNSLTGPGLATWDFSAVKDTRHGNRHTVNAVKPVVSDADVDIKHFAAIDRALGKSTDANPAGRIGGRGLVKDIDADSDVPITREFRNVFALRPRTRRQ